MLVFILTAYFATALPLLAQEPQHSYLVYVHVVHLDVARQDGTDACLIAADDGLFQFETSPTTPQTSFSGARPSAGRMGRNSGPVTVESSAPVSPRVYRGHLDPARFDQLKSLVQSPELAGIQSAPPPNSMVVAHAYDKVSLRIHRDTTTQELEFITIDGRGNMPKSVRAFIPYMDSLPKSIGHSDRNAEPRDCGGLEATSDFKPQLQKR